MARFRIAVVFLHGRRAITSSETGWPNARVSADIRRECQLAFPRTPLYCTIIAVRGNANLRPTSSITFN